MNDTARSPAAPAGWGIFPVPERFEQRVGPLYQKEFGDGWRFGILVEPGHCHNGGIMHGGAMMTLADHAMVMQHFFAHGFVPVLTAQMNVEMLAGAQPGDWVEARPSVTRETRSLLFAQCELWNGETLMMTASAVLKKSSGPAASTDVFVPLPGAREA
jgi:acyl-coenzyme A thioesterase PaaI-like protein